MNSNVYESEKMDTLSVLKSNCTNQFKIVSISLLDKPIDFLCYCFSHYNWHVSFVLAQVCHIELYLNHVGAVRYNLGCKDERVS